MKDCDCTRLVQRFAAYGYTGPFYELLVSFGRI